METILEPKTTYPFDDIIIKTPKALQGGTYSAKLEVDGKPLIIQTPKCKTKNGIHTTVKQIYCDLLMNQDHIEFINWLRKVQDKVRNLILENSDTWFHEAPTLDEVEYNWNDSIRTYKSVNYLVRTFVHKTKNINTLSLQIFDTDENELSLEEVTADKNVIGILEIIGLKFSSTSFHLEICLRQLMVINEKPLFGKCLIKLNNEMKKIPMTNNIKAKKENDEFDEETENEMKQEIVLDNKNISNLVDISNNEQDKNNNLGDDDEYENDEITQEDVIDNLSNDDLSNDDLSNDNLSKNVTNDLSNVEIPNINLNQQDDTSTELSENKLNNIDSNDIIDEFSSDKISPVKKEKQEEISTSLDNSLEEIELEIDNSSPITLKNPNEVYLDIYKAAREKAKRAKREAIKAYLEAKRIKELYLLDAADSSDDESDDDEDVELFSEN